MKPTWKDFVRNSRKSYMKIGRIPCPALNGEPITFNRHGFNHLLWKGNKMRTRDEQEKRLGLIDLAVEIVKTAIKSQGYRYRTRKSETIKKFVLAQFWSFKKKINGRTITVVIRQTANGQKHFLSVMDDSGYTKTP